MEEDIILRFIEGKCTPEEQMQVFEKMENDPDFKNEMLVMKNLYVNRNLPENEASDEALTKFRHFVESKEASENKGQKRGRKWIMAPLWSAAAVIIVLLALNLTFNRSGQKGKEPTVQISTLPTEMVNSLYTAKGVKGTVILPDGSKVALNSDSKITYPASFSGSSREVEFSGEGFFEVAKDSLHPMIIHCNKDFRVEVYGTTFNLKTYSNDNTARTTLISGAIRVVEKKFGKEISTDIIPNQEYVITNNAESKVKTLKNPDVKYAWKDGKLLFDSTPLSEAAKILERWHGVKIVIENKNLNNIPITASFSTESLVQIMDLLNFSMEIDYRIKDSVLYIN